MKRQNRFISKRAERNKSIYILLTKSDTCISKIINLTTADRYTHVSISFDESLQPLYSFARKYVHFPLPAGLRHEPLDAGFFKRYSYIPCALYELKVTEDTYNRAKRQVERMMKRQKEYRFSVLGLILCRLSIPFHRKHFYFCSEFVGSVLEESNALSLPKAPSLMRPNDYSKFSNMSCKFEGRLNTLIQELDFSKVPAYSSRSSKSCWSIFRIGNMIPFIGGR